MLQQARELLQQYYGYPSFREGQEKIIASILHGMDTVGIMPTGGGKSICFQIPALLAAGATLVISPLISLMKDQVDALDSLGIPATFINSSLEPREVEERITNAKEGKYKLLYVAPERLEAGKFRSLLQSLPVSLLAIDEAHCISQWGHDFRPSYLSISALIKELPKRPVVAAFTATATEEVTKDMIRLLSLKNANVFISGFDRPNLSFEVVRGENKKDFVLSYLTQNSQQAGIIYAATRKEVDALWDFLIKKGYRAGKYHAGLDDAERRKNQEAFLYDEIQVMVATNAFGMGIDKSNVRYVIHYNMPKNMEAYYQEAGRAGRDGEPSQCILLFSPQDIIVQKYLIEQNILAPERKSHEYKKLQIMVDFCHTPRCLRSYILEYFGEEHFSKECGNCSNCNNDTELQDITVEAQKVFSCIWRMKERYGVAMVADVLKGSKSKKVLQLGFAGLPTYGILEAHTVKEIADMINLLTAEGYLKPTQGQYPVLKLEPKAIAVLKSEAKVWQKVPKSRPDVVPDDSLFEQLRLLRREIAQIEHVPPYIIFPDSTLRAMSEQYPADAESMLAINGVGRLKFAKYGLEFIAAIRQYAEEKRIVLASNRLPASGKTKQTEEDPSHVSTYKLFQDGKNLDEIAMARNLKPVTIQDHLIRCGLEGYEINWDMLIPQEHEAMVLEKIKELGAEKLKPLKEALPAEVDYMTIKAILCKHQYMSKIQTSSS